MADVIMECLFFFGLGIAGAVITAVLLMVVGMASCWAADKDMENW